MPPRPPTSRAAVATAIACTVLPVALAMAVWTYGLQRHRLRGDEPHYLIMADALVTDHSFDLKKAYQRNDETQAIFGRIGPHTIYVGDAWMPYHTPGLSMLIALPLRLDGERGVRFTLVLLALILTGSLFAWTRRTVGLRDAAWLTLGVTICTPMVFGASRVFPDLPAGILATACGLWLMERPGRDGTVLAWLLVGLASGCLAWLNIKYYGAAGVLLAGIVAVGAYEWKTGRRGTTLRALAAAVCVLALLGALVRFNLWAYGVPFGGRNINELTTSFSRGAELFLGLHYDQSQGLFVRNPLLLAGLLFLPVFIRRRPVAAVFWALLYLSLILPNGLEMARYGGGAPTARFTWSAIWLWSVPIGVGLATLPSFRRWLPAAVIAALAYQGALAVYWLTDPARLFPRLAEQIDQRDSIFPVGLRWFLPSFYFWDFSSYWTYGPNLAAFGLTVVLLAVGTVLAARLGRQAPAVSLES